MTNALSFGGLDLSGTNSQNNFAGLSRQVTSFQAKFNFNQTSTTEIRDQQGTVQGTYSSAVSISLSISAVNITSGILKTEQNLDNTRPNFLSESNDRRGRGLEKQLIRTLQNIEQNGEITGRDAKRLFKLTSALNQARNTATPLNQLSVEERTEIRFIRFEVKSIFQENRSSALDGDTTSRFLDLLGRLEDLRNFALKATELLSALQGEDEEETEEVDTSSSDLELVV